MTPSMAATPRRPEMAISRAMMTKPAQAQARPTATRAKRAPATSSLSAMVSRKAPSVLVMCHRRARKPSSQSVKAAANIKPAAIQ